MGETSDISGYVASIGYEEVPEETKVHAKTAIRDYIGVALYGSRHEVGTSIYDYLDAHGGDGGATVIHRGKKSAPAAALANGAFGHAIDYDDTFESIVIHPTSPVFAAALAAVEEADATTKELLTAYVVGCEVAFRVGHSTYPEHYQKGWHSTGTAGSFGAAAASASALGLSEDEIAHAFGIVASSSSSLKKNFGTMTKPLHAGHAAQMGVRAALLAQSGFTADPDIFEDDIGYSQVMTIDGAYNPKHLTEDLYEEWNVLDIGFKPYPSGVITHAAMDAMRALVRDNDLDPSEVESVVVTLDEAASEMLHHEQPQNALQAKFSIEFCLAAILREKRAGIHEFSDKYILEPETQDAIGKVSRSFEPNLFGDEFAGYGAIVRLMTTDGEELREAVRYAPGSPNNPLDKDRLRQKFFECAEAQIPQKEAEELEHLIMNLEERDLKTFTMYLQ